MTAPGKSTAQDPWCGRFVDVRLLRSGPVLHRFTASDGQTGDRRLVIIGAPDVDQDEVGARLHEAARVLSLIAHEDVPAVDQCGHAGHGHFLSLACDVWGDVAGLCRRAAAAGRRLDLAATSGLANRFLGVLTTAHATVDPRTAQPLYLGGLSWANVLLSTSGKPWFLGWGDDLLVRKPDTAGMLTAAPEVMLGAPASAGGDLWAVLTMFRALFPMRDLPTPILRVLQGQARAGDEAVRAVLHDVHRRVLVAPESRTMDAREMHDAYRQVWRLVGVTPSLEALRAALTVDGPRPVCPDGQVTIGPEASWVRVGADTLVDLSRRHAMRRMVWALACAFESPGASELSTAELLAVGWPGERVVHEAGVHRVHVAIAQVRRLGLGSALVRGEKGYRLAGHVELEPGTRAG